MIPVPAGVRVWLATGHTDMRRGFPGLALLVQEGRANFTGEHGGESAHECNQCEGSQSGFGRRSALSFQADQQADGEAREEL